MLGFLANHPVFTLSVIGSLIGTFFSYVAPVFTRDYLCADEDFSIGNLGIAVFIHDGFSHLLGNLFFMIPGSLLCEHFYNSKIILAIVIFYAFLESMLCIPMKKASCGYSGVSFMLCSMACMYGIHWWGFLIWLILVAASFLDNGSHTDVFSHILGFIFGATFGIIIQVII